MLIPVLGIMVWNPEVTEAILNYIAFIESALWPVLAKCFDFSVAFYVFLKLSSNKQNETLRQWGLVA